MADVSGCWQHLPVLWRVTVDHPSRGGESQSFGSVAGAWQQVDLLVAEFESEGWVAGRLETVRYGERWLQRLARDAAEVLIQVERLNDGSPVAADV